MYRFFIIIPLVLYQASVFMLLRRVHSVKTLLYFLLPELAIGVAIIWSEFFLPDMRGKRFAFLIRELLPFAGGAVSPILVFLVPNLLTGSLPQFVQDVFILPGRRFTYASLQPGGSHATLAVVTDLLVIAAVLLTGTRVRSLIAILTLIATPAVLLIAQQKSIAYAGIWQAVWALVPIVVVLGIVILLWSSMGRQLGVVWQQKVFLILGVTATCNLIQFPFVAPIYLCYVLPLTILAITALTSCLKDPPRWTLASLFCFCLLYAVFEVTPGFIYTMGGSYSPDRQTVRLSPPRAGRLRVTPAAAKTYEELGILLQQHSHGEYIYATPDCPEVYFLYGLRNPTRTLYDFLEDPVSRTQRVLKLIQDHDLRLVVLNRNPEFSGPVPQMLQAELERQFPNRATAGKFDVRWK